MTKRSKVKDQTNVVLSGNRLFNACNKQLFSANTTIDKRMRVVRKWHQRSQMKYWVRDPEGLQATMLKGSAQGEKYAKVYAEDVGCDQLPASTAEQLRILVTYIKCRLGPKFKVVIRELHCANQHVRVCWDQDYRNWNKTKTKMKSEEA